MSKGKKRNFSLPFGIKTPQEQSKLAKAGIPPPPKPRKKKETVVKFEFDKGFTFPKRDGFYRLGVDPAQPGGGYVEIPPNKQGYYYSESGIWDKERLRQLLELMPEGMAFPQEYPSEVSETKDPTDEWVENWIDNEKSKGSV